MSKSIVYNSLISQLILYENLTHQNRKMVRILQLEKTTLEQIVELSRKEKSPCLTNISILAKIQHTTNVHHTVKATGSLFAAPVAKIMNEGTIGAPVKFSHARSVTIFIKIVIKKLADEGSRLFYRISFSRQDSTTLRKRHSN